MHPAVSVVIPTYNRAKYVAASLASIYAQSVRPDAIIIVDDASKDDTIAVIKAMRPGPVALTIIESTENRGGGHARNVGIDAVRTPFIAFLDSDDIWHSEKLERQLSTVAQGCAEQFLCFSNLEVDRNDGSPPSPWNHRSFASGDSPRDYILVQEQAIQTSTFLMPTATARRVRFDQRLRRHQDLDFVFRAEMAGVQFVYLPDILVTYSADPQAARTSRRVNAAPSLAWLEIASAYLSQAQRDAFYFRHVFDMEWQQSPLSATQRGLAATLRGNVAWPRFLRALAAEVIPSPLRRRLRSFIKSGGS